MQHLRSKITKPLCPLWITPDSSNPSEPTCADAYFPIVCCTVSRHIQSSELSEDGYVQGAADDSESWALGITPWMLWEHRKTLMDTSEADLPELIRELQSMEPAPVKRRATLVRPTETIFISTLAAIDPTSYDGIVICSQPTDVIELSGSEVSKPQNLLELNCGRGKLGSRALRSQLQDVPGFIERLSSKVKNPKLLFACSTGQDLSAGVALAVICLYFNEERKWLGPTAVPFLNIKFCHMDC